MESVNDLKGSWNYQSFLVLPTKDQLSAPPTTLVNAKKWAMGQLIVSGNSNQQLQGELVFAPGITLEVTGSIQSADGSTPASLNAVGKGLQGPTQGAIYLINGWIVPTALGQDGLVTVRGSVLNARGPDASPKVGLSGSPVGTTGAFILTAL